MEKNSFGNLTRAADGYQVEFVRMLDHDIQAVWEAITDPEKLRMWFTDIDMDFKPGGQITFKFRDELRTETHGKIVTIQPPTTFAFTWEDEFALWELSEPTKGKCILKFTYSKLSDEYAVSASAGFHTLLDRLTAMLKGSTSSYPLGTEESDPEQIALQSEYGKIAYRQYPELKRFEPIRLERTFNATVERVWKALTDPDEMRQWYFDLEAFRPEVGFEFQFRGQGHKGEQYLHLCKITEVVPLRKLTYSWQYEGYEGDSFVSFELFPEENSTRLRLTHRGLGTFPVHPDFARESFLQGWTELITVSLDKYLSELKLEA